ncbi:MAG: extracellular solute-binding protein [Clostridia bacterium]|nr:extracellular solute-binding protein [Clostridia bacterium]
MKNKKLMLIVAAVLAVAVVCAVVIPIATCDKGPAQKVLHSNPQVLADAGVYPILKEEYKDQITLKIMGANNAAINPDWSQNKFFQRMEAKTGVKFTFEVYGDDMYDEKKSLALSTENNLPDIFFKANFSNYDEVTYGGKSLRSLNELIDGYAPNIKALLDANPALKKSITTTDGNIYALPTIYTNLPDGITNIMRDYLWINQAWLTELNLEMPGTPEEFLNVMRVFKQKKCTGKGDYPFVVAGIDHLLNVFNFFGMDLKSYWVQANGNGGIEFMPQTEEFRSALQFIRTMVSEGLMNDNWAVMDATTLNATGASGTKYGCYSAAAPQYVVGYGENMREYVTLDPISPTGENGFWGASFPAQRGCFAITTVCKYPEAAIRWIDALYDFDLPCNLWAIIGEENKEWKWNDEKTAWFSTVSDKDYAKVMATTIIQTGDGMPYLVDESFWEKQETAIDKYTRPLRNRQMKHGKVGYPLVYFNSKDLREIGDLATDINNYVNRYIAAVISGDKNLDSDWTTFKTFNRLSLDRYMEILTKAYNEYKV